MPRPASAEDSSAPVPERVALQMASSLELEDVLSTITEGVVVD